MPSYCSVFGCYASSSKNPELSFFLYPKDKKLRNAWICRVRREDFSPSSTSCICSRHFLDTDMTIPNSDTPSMFQRRRLRKEAIPSVNLRGNTQDEKQGKRSTSVLNRNRSCATEETSSEISPDSDLSEGPLLEYEMPSSADNSRSSAQYSVEELLKKVEISEKMCFRYKNLSETDIKNYTGIEKPVFKMMIDTIETFAPLNFWSGKPVKSISPEDQLLIFLMRLRLDLPYFDLSRRYSVSQTTIQNILMTYLHAVHKIFFVGIMSQIPSQEKNKCSLPSSFGDISNCRIIIDCTEFRISAPRKDLVAASATYSNYKHFLSVKYLIGVAPNGAITFVSHGFPGSTSDKVVTSESGVISHLQVSQSNVHILSN